MMRSSIFDALGFSKRFVFREPGDDVRRQVGIGAAGQHAARRQCQQADAGQQREQRAS
jgi:hypothetical protein